jgi:small subunit ribosomal protein S20
LANHKSAEKRARQRITRTQRNRRLAGTMRTALKKARAALEGKAKDADALVKLAIREIDKAVTKGVVHKKTGSRLVSRLSLRQNKA